MLSPAAAALGLGISLSRFYQLRTDYLRACAQGQADAWSPGVSGGDHHPDWSEEAIALATKLLASKPPSSYSAVASELHRRLNFKTNRASVRRWAIENKLNHDTRYKIPPKPVKRWQARDYGALWQYDATPHAWFRFQHRQFMREDRQRLLAPAALDDVRVEGGLLVGCQAAFHERRQHARIGARTGACLRCRFQHGAQQPIRVGVTLLIAAHSCLPY